MEFNQVNCLLQEKSHSFWKHNGIQSFYSVLFKLSKILPKTIEEEENTDYTQKKKQSKENDPEMSQMI